MKNITQPHLNNDLAGYCPANPNYLQIRARMNRLVDRYLSIEILSHRLTRISHKSIENHDLQVKS